MYGDSQQVHATHKGGGGAPALRTPMRLWHLWSLQRGKHLEGWFWCYTSLLSPSGFVSFHVCLWIFARSSSATVLLLVWCVQMWRLADCSAIAGCESTLTGMDGLASELQGPQRCLEARGQLLRGSSHQHQWTCHSHREVEEDSHQHAVDTKYLQ